MSEQSGLDRLTTACGVLRARVVMTAIALAAGAVALGLLVLSLLPGAWRESRGAVAPLVIAALLLAALLGVAAAWRRASGALDPEDLADEADSAAGLGAGDVRAALELVRAGAAPELTELHRSRVGRRLGELSPDRMFPRTGPRWRRRARGALLAGGVALLALGLAALARPQPTRSAVIALGTPWRTAFPPPLPALSVALDGRVGRGEAAAVRVRAVGRRTVVLAWRAAGQPPGRDSLTVGEGGLATGRTPPVTSPTRVWAEDEESRSSDTLLVRPAEPLLVQDLRVEVRYPAYLGRPAELHRGQVPILIVPEGARIVLSGEANLELSAAELVWHGEDDPSAGAPPAEGPEQGERAPFPLAVDGMRFGATLSPRESGAWEWRLEAEDAIGEAILPDPLRVILVPDRPPEIRLLFPAPDTILGPDLVMPLVVDVEDDIGLGDVFVRSWRSGLGAERDERRESLEPRASGSRRTVFRHLLDRSAGDLLPGDTLFYRVEAFDGNRARGPATSDVFLLRVPTLSETRRDRAERTEDLATAAAELEEALDELAEAATDAARRASDTESAEGRFETTEEARAVLEDAERAAEGLSGLEEEIRALEDELSRSAASDEALAERMEALAERYRELAESGLLDRIEELAESLRELDMETVRETLERLSEDSEWLREELEQTLGMLERAALEQAVRSARADADDVAEEQRALAETEPEGEVWAEEQESLAARSERLSDTLDELERRLEEAGRTDAADSAASARASTDRALESMREAAEAGSADPSREESGAGTTEAADRRQESARQAAASMERAAETLGSAQRDVSGEGRSAASETLRRARGEALALAEEEGRLVRATRGEEMTDPETWRSRQGAVRQGLENLLDRLAGSGNEAALLDRETGAAAGEAAQRMDALLRRLAEDGAGRLPSRTEAEAIQTALNDLAVQLLAAERAASASERGAQGQEAAERMAALARQQQGVAQQTSSLLVPGPRPAGGERREEVARRQGEIGERLAELDDPDGELLGRPEELAAEAQELARELRDRGPTQETLERQRRLFRRMLDAGRSLEDEDLDPDRRESRTGRAVPREAPAIDEALLRGRRFPLPPEALLRELPMFYRPLIFEYFDRLNRSAEPPGDGSRNEP